MQKLTAEGGENAQRAAELIQNAKVKLDVSDWFFVTGCLSEKFKM